MCRNDKKREPCHSAISHAQLYGHGHSFAVRTEQKRKTFSLTQYRNTLFTNVPNIAQHSSAIRTGDAQKSTILA